MSRGHKILFILLILGFATLLAGGVLLIPHWQEFPFFAVTPTPQLQFTPPVSLSELATQYPRFAPLLTNPELGSIYKEFLLAYEEGGKEAALEMARQRGLLTPEGDVAVTLILDTEDPGALVAQLEGIGVTVVSAYRDRVNVAIPIALIESSLESDEPGAILNQLTELEHVIAIRLPPKRVQDGGAITTEGAAVIEADRWHEAGFTGAGVRIGVLDLGFRGYEQLLGTELPDHVDVATFGFFDPEEVHGVACAEIIHDVAPDAQLFFAWYDGSDAGLGEAVDWLLSQGVHIISHSASSLAGPRDGSEWEARLVDDVAARGILWVNSTGNAALSHYRGLFTDQDGDSFHEFGPGDEVLALPNSGYVEVMLNWEDDWGSASQDLELYLYDARGNELGSSEDEQTGQPGQEPVEGIGYYHTQGRTVYAVVRAYRLDYPVMLDIFVDGAEVEYPSPAYSLGPPSDAIGALAVGAAKWQDDSLAPYSSQGPTVDGRLKPEISAPTGVSSVTYGREEFQGTSASCPHVAGAAALVWQAHPEFTRQEVVDFLLSNALDLGVTGPDTGYGYGRLRLPQPVQATPVPLPTPTPLPEQWPTPAYPPVLTPTPVAYSTPQPPPSPSAGVRGGVLSVAGVMVLGTGLCCLGVSLLLIGGVGLFISRRGISRGQPPMPPYAPPPATPYTPPGRCPKCGTAVTPGARFCRNCGHHLGPAVSIQRCPYCGTELRSGARFCPNCGKRVHF